MQRTDIGAKEETCAAVYCANLYVTFKSRKSLKHRDTHNKKDDTSFE